MNSYTEIETLGWGKIIEIIRPYRVKKVTRFAILDYLEIFIMWREANHTHLNPTSIATTIYRVSLIPKTKEGAMAWIKTYYQVVMELELDLQKFDKWMESQDFERFMNWGDHYKRAFKP